ncbi:polymer-forming cytoskeletal protein [Halosimplex salinum]|uniref:polymer-forming cytoskeletal protein n=1 Tax=Halosimplex salinum TaxID=1710538 RepID=UPI000F4756F6|nr:polymer-forming cytoskeletal protein [Halosimplex salinum]
MVKFGTEARSSRAVALVCSLVVALALLPGAAAAVPALADGPDAGSAPADQTVGDDLVVGPDETVSDDLTVASGDVLVRGTVEGDLTAMAGSVEVTGDVTGDVTATAGSVTVDGRVGGTVEAAAGSVDVGPDAVVEGDVEAAAGTVTVDGTVEDDVTGSDTVRLGDGASVGGDVTYGEEIERASGATVDGRISEDDSLGWQFDNAEFGLVLGDEFAGVPSLLVAVVSGFSALVVGGLLLLLFPEFTAEMVETVTTDPVRASAAGVATLIAAPAVLIATAMTLIGIPLALAGGAVFALLVWVALVYGEFLVGDRVLAAAGVHNRWAALALGVFGVQALGRVPVFGDLITLAVTLLGLGTGALALAARWRGDGGDDSVESPPPNPSPDPV